MVVDDEPLIAMLLQDWLKELGYSTIGPASTITQAIALIESDKPDAAILDVSLHQTDCYPVADLLKERDIPFAFGTGHDTQAIASRHANVPILSKPYDLSALQRVMHELLPNIAARGS
jgi:CheY-like chemotaxis protein